MKHPIDPVIKTASDLTAASKRIVDDSVEFFRGSLGGISLFTQQAE